MERVFLYLLTMSITASLLVVAVLALRLVLKKAPKALFCILWGFVAIRLIFPVSPESPFSLIPTGLTISDTVLSDAGSWQGTYPSMTALPDTESHPVTFSDEVDFILPDMINTVSPEPRDTADTTAAIIPTGSATDSTDSVRTVFHQCLFIASVLWPLGVLAMLVYAGISYLRIHKKVKEAVLLNDNIWLCDHVETPFILGIFRPRILLPSSIQPAEAQHVIAHEKAHLKRLDHFWKPLGFLLLSIYWFNPVLWIAYLFLCKDIELACDERVLRKMDAEDIKSYSSTLLNYSISRTLISVCPLAFGEVHVKKRIKNALHYKKPAFWIIIIAVLSCAVVAVCFLTNPVKQEEEAPDKTEDKGEIAYISFDVTAKGSDFTGIEIAPLSYSFFSESSLENIPLEIQWNNKNYNSDFTYGLKFDILYYENGIWTSCAAEAYSFPEVACSLPRKSAATQTYSLNGFDLSKEGLYRFQAEPQPGQYTWFDFNTIVVRKDNPDTLTDSALLSIAYAITKDKVTIQRSIAEYPELYNLLLSGGDTTVDCFVKELNHTDQYGITEYLMAKICSELTGIGTEEGAYDPDTWWATADQWLRIYNAHLAAEKYAELAISQSNLPSDTAAAWKNTQLLSDDYNPQTPMPRSLVWVNYYYNRQKQTDGMIVVELPEFPGITFYADSQKIYADTPAGQQTLISGSTIWTTYLADLNSDNYPEICSTVSTTSDSSDLSIVVYDFKNQMTYELRDSDRYDYALFGNYNSMFVQKIDRSKVEATFVGNLTLTTVPEQSTAVLTLTKARRALYHTSWLADNHLDLLGYSNLYADLVLGKSQQNSPILSLICCIFRQEDWEAFTTAYPEVSIWKGNQTFSIEEAFQEDMVSYMENYQNPNQYPAIYLSSHGLSLGTSSLPATSGFSETEEPQDSFVSVGHLTLKTY